MEAEYVAACEATKKTVWLCKFLTNLGVILDMNKPLKRYCGNNEAVTNSKEPRSYTRGKHI